jgi:hypothetical protein
LVTRLVSQRRGQRRRQNDLLGGVGDLVVELVNRTIAGSGVQQQMLGAAVRGFFAELGLTADQAERSGR